MGCGDGAASSSHSRGRLRGTVMRGPTSPVCSQGTPCSEPASGAQLVFARGGQTVARVVVAKNGGYSVSLRPGSYDVSVATHSLMSRKVAPGTAHVVGGRTRTVDFQIDTGIR